MCCDIEGEDEDGVVFMVCEKIHFPVSVNLYVLYRHTTLQIYHEYLSEVPELGDLIQYGDVLLIMSHVRRAEAWRSTPDWIITYYSERI